MIQLNNDRKDFISPTKSSIKYLNNKTSLDSDGIKNNYFEYDTNLKNKTNHKDISTSTISLSNSSGSKEYFKSTYLNDQNKDLKDDLKIRKIKDNNIEDKIYENPYRSYKQEFDDEKNNHDKILDSEFLKLMDKKLKKLIKTNFRLDETNSNSAYKSCYNDSKVNPISWNISPNKQEINKKYCGENNNFDIDDSICSSFITNQQLSHPYLPLRDVPMHDLVKKLQREFELEDGEIDGLSGEYKNLWEK